MPTTSLRLCTILLLLSSVAVAASVGAHGHGCPSYRCGDAVDIRYPFWVEDGNRMQTQCGYPGLRLHCRGGAPLLPLPSGDYYVTRILYSDNYAGDQTVSLVDAAISADRTCPRVAGRNLTLPRGSPPLLKLTHRDVNITFYTNCTFEGLPPWQVPCLETADGRHHTYVFHEDDPRLRASYAMLCDDIVGVPVLRRALVNSTGPLDGIMAALGGGFELRWRHAFGGKCAACEKAGGACGQRRDARGTSSFVCVHRF